MRTLPLIQYGFEALQRERPHVYARFCALVDGLSMQLQTEEGELYYSFNPTGHRENRSQRTADVEIGCLDAVLRSLALGETTILDELLSDRLHVKGSAWSLATFDEALPLWIVGVMGCRESEDLFERWAKSESATRGRSNARL